MSPHPAEERAPPPPGQRRDHRTEEREPPQPRPATPVPFPPLSQFLADTGRSALDPCCTFLPPPVRFPLLPGLFRNLLIFWRSAKAEPRLVRGQAQRIGPVTLVQCGGRDQEPPPSRGNSTQTRGRSVHGQRRIRAILDPGAKESSQTEDWKAEKNPVPKMTTRVPIEKRTGAAQSDVQRLIKVLIPRRIKRATAEEEADALLRRSELEWARLSTDQKLQRTENALQTLLGVYVETESDYDKLKTECAPNKGDAMRAELAACQKDLKAAENSLRKKEAELKDLKISDVGQLNYKVKQLEDELEDKVKEIKKIKEDCALEVEGKDKAISGLMKELEAAKEETAAKEKELKKLKARCRDAEAAKDREIKKLTDTQKEAEYEIAAKVAALAKLKTDYEQLETDKDKEIAKEKKTATEMEVLLNEKIAELKKWKADCANTDAEKEAEMKKLKEAEKAAIEAFDLTKEEIAKLKKQMEETEKQKDDEIERLKKSLKTSEEKEAEIAKLNKQMKETEKQKDDEITALKQNKKLADELAAEETAAKMKLKAECDKAKQDKDAEIKKLEDEKANLEKGKEAEIKKLEDEKANLEKDKDAEIKKLKDEKADLEKNKEAEIKKLKDEMADLEKAKEAEIKKLENEKANLEKDKETEIKKLEDEKTDLGWYNFCCYFEHRSRNRILENSAEIFMGSGGIKVRAFSLIESESVKHKHPSYICDFHPIILRR
ncbi:uncharacterized protein MCAP_0864-like [Narcine bancroftii]|uniref:uncharacterized protein MCAP_0864-like n=1 Tax=Narcine bancroftii TaxID=1343680 RepID=UPI0038317C27